MHPYSHLPDRSFWTRFVSHSPWRNLNLNDRPKFLLAPDARVATAGSCFAQHITRYMNNAGLTPYTAERAHPLALSFGGETDSYTLFSARYGNIYTTRQCLELFQQAFGLIPVIHDYVEDKGRFYDLLRPNAVPDGFATLAEARADRLYHLERVKVLFETTDVFIFTLGLTECWYNTQNGHTYPACPGTARGSYLPQQHAFRNFTCAEVTADLHAFIAALARVNPALKLILTVSPVPLVATQSEHNVLLASSYSKSVLRAACGEVEPAYDHVAYFPSYEIISHPACFGQYLESDLRGVTERGVSHVMDCFLSSFYAAMPEPGSAPAPAVQAAPAPQTRPKADVCEELFNEFRHAATAER